MSTPDPLARALKARAASPKYEVLAKWRNGWQLIKHPATGKHYLRRMMRGQYEVTATRDGAAWCVRTLAGERVSPGQLR